MKRHPSNNVPASRTVHTLSLLALLSTLNLQLSTTCTAALDFKAELFGEPTRINANIVTQTVTTGYVRINGVATGLAAQPLWDFGDGKVVGSWFPAEHTYAPPRSNYIVRVTGFFTDGVTNWTEVLVRFAQPVISPVPLPAQLGVTIPTNYIALLSRMPGYGFSSTLTNFDDSFFSTNLPRAAVEYLLSVAATVQNDLANSNVFLVDGGFRQRVLRDPAFGGMYSIWYSSPVAFGSGDYGFQGTPGYTSFFHEMGHNVSLNFPAGYYYGGKIDGNANAIYSETLAQIFQHATAYEIINHAAAYGLPPDLVFDIHQSARGSMAGVRQAYEDYLSSGTNFFSWNDPATPADGTFNTFMTLAYKFCAHAETAGQGYRLPTQRLMRLLAVFNPDLCQQYDQQHNTPAADQFRATLLVTALSYAFQSDLRSEFRALRFPISDAVHDQLMGLVDPAPRVTAIGIEGDSVRVTWTCLTNHTYVVETSPNLSAGGFTNCSPVIAVPSGFSGSTTNYLHSGGPLSAQRYYRVRLAS
jgi:hypothetical protein